MADLATIGTAPATGWASESAWAGILAPNRQRRRGDAQGVRVEAVEDLALASLIARAGASEALRARCTELFGITPPDEPRRVTGADIAFVWSGPGHWLATSPNLALASRLRESLDELAAISDQGASRAILRISGPRTRDVLAKGCMIDLHPAIFGDGHVAVTVIGHIGVQLWREDESFVLAVSRSYAGTFWSWLAASAAEFGCDVAG